MDDFEGFVNLIKLISENTIEASKLTKVVFGKVTSENPLKIKVTQKLILSGSAIVLTRNVTDFETMVRQSGGEKRSMKIYNALKVGDEVVMSRLQGGQKFLVIDRIGGEVDGTE